MNCQSIYTYYPDVFDPFNAFCRQYALLWMHESKRDNVTLYHSSLDSSSIALSSSSSLLLPLFSPLSSILGVIFFCCVHNFSLFQYFSIPLGWFNWNVRAHERNSNNNNQIENNTLWKCLPSTQPKVYCSYVQQMLFCSSLSVCMHIMNVTKGNHSKFILFFLTSYFFFRGIRRNWSIYGSTCQIGSKQILWFCMQFPLFQLNNISC